MSIYLSTDSKTGCSMGFGANVWLRRPQVDAAREVREHQRFPHRLQV